MQRYNVFNDRVDYTLFDIKNYFEKKEYKINYNIKPTKEWLDSFKCNNGKDFDNFIEKMDLKRWCIKNKDNIEKNGKYKVINIETNKEITNYMYHKKENYRMIRKYYPITMTYIENLIKKVKE